MKNRGLEEIKIPWHINDMLKIYAEQTNQKPDAVAGQILQRFLTKAIGTRSEKTALFQLEFVQLDEEPQSED